MKVWHLQTIYGLQLQKDVSCKQRLERGTDVCRNLLIAPPLLEMGELGESRSTTNSSREMPLELVEGYAGDDDWNEYCAATNRSALHNWV